MDSLLAGASCRSKSTMAGYAGRDLSDMIEINRDKNSNNISVSVDGVSSGWCIYAGATVDTIDMSIPLYTAAAHGVYDIDVPHDRRSYFQFISGNDKAIIAERQLPLVGGCNFRDLGGYRTADGRYVKWGKILRSDNLGSLTKADLTYIASIFIQSVVDFRSKEEVDMAPDKMSLSNAEYYQLPIEPGSLNDLRNFTNLKSDEVEAKMRQMNEYFVTDDAAIAQWKELFSLLQRDGTEPLVFHCSAGKDRTGMAAALILLALGVPEKTVMDDYLLSNDCLAGKYQQYIDRYAELKSLFLVKREFLQAGIDRLRHDYGSPEVFLTEILGVNVERFKDKYLY